MTTGKTLSPNNAINTDSKRRAFVAPLLLPLMASVLPLLRFGDNAELNRERLPLLSLGEEQALKTETPLGHGLAPHWVVRAPAARIVLLVASTSGRLPDCAICAGVGNPAGVCDLQNRIRRGGQDGKPSRSSEKCPEPRSS